MENKNFKNLISLIEQNSGFLSELAHIENKFLVKIYKITELNVPTVVDLYTTMQRKFYLNRKTSNEESWYENELRIFVWLLFGYLYVFQKQIDQLNEDDWKIFSPIFNYKSHVFFEFQSASLIRPANKSNLWLQEQTQLLESIISQKNYKNRWNSIARELFIRSSKKYFRNPKQCRERWMNHLDPSKIRTEWTASEDLTLLNCIKKNGKKWSVAMKQLSNRRTEHMVKNRYKSLISNQSKKHPGKKESQLEHLLIKKLSKLLEKHAKDSIKDSERSEETQCKSIKEDQLAMIQLKEQPTMIELKEQKQQGSQLMSFKFGTKEEEMKCEQECSEFNFVENFNNNLEDFGVNSPMFIPWKLNEINYPFFINEDGTKYEDHFHANILSQNEEDLLF